VLKAEPSHVDYLVLDLGKISIYNKRLFNKKRIINAGQSGLENTYTECFNLIMNEIGIRIIKGDKEYEMSKPFNFNLSV
jgi:hypothetical protein